MNTQATDLAPTSDAREKPDACPNPECKGDRVSPFTRDDAFSGLEMYMKCLKCKTCGPAAKVPAYDVPDRLKVALASAVRLWNRLPRAAGRGGLM